MVILFDSACPVKSSRRPFARGLARPERLPIGPSPEDSRWWAENSPSNRYGYEVVGPADLTDSEADRMAEEAEWFAAYERGLDLA